MKLLLDVGNQRCKCAGYDQGLIQHYPAIEIERQSKIYIPDVMRQADATVDAVWVCSVQDQAFNQALSATIQEQLHQTPVFAQIKPSVGGCTTSYRPQALGVDRFLALVGAWQQFHQACFVIDCGTAVTVDALDSQGVHQGGVIMPGLKMMKNSLYKDTAQLVAGEGKEIVFAKNTADAIDSGCRRLLSAAIAITLSDMRTEMDGLCVATGGDGQWLAQTDRDFLYREALVLEGLAVMAEGSE